MNSKTRCAKSTSFKIQLLTHPFSNFEFLENDKNYQGVSSLKRLFSLARSQNCKTVIIEDIIAEGAVLSEINNLSGSGIRNTMLQRLSFWESEICDKSELTNIDSQNLKGYLVYKVDKYPDSSTQGHVFEAVFQKYQHHHNFIPDNNKFRLNIDTHSFELQGMMYCQQNAINKCCAHVALRSLLSGIVKDDDLSYEDIHNVSQSSNTPRGGLNSVAIRSVLDYYHVNYFDLDYRNSLPEVTDKYPYSK